MRILIDIGHPAHVHYFRNFIKIMKSRGHEFLITARDKEVTFSLLKYYNIPFISRGKGRKGFLGKLVYLLEGNYFILKEARKFKTDLFLSFGSPYAAQVAFLLRKPHISFDDTEHAKLEHAMYVPFTNTILTPSCFKKNFGKKHIKFDGYMELCSLHPKYFSSSREIQNLNMNGFSDYIIIRFVSWGAGHDFGHKGIDIETKRELIKILSKYVRVFISSESNLPEEFEKYKLSIPPEKIHSLLVNALFYIGEGATTASESVMVGTPAIYVNTLDAGTLQEQCKYGLLFNMQTSSGLIDKSLELLNNKNLKEDAKTLHRKMLSEKIDVTAFMVWFVENYPNSFKVMKKKPDYQNNFR